MEQQHRYYQVGTVALDVCSALPEVLSDLELLYGWFRTDSPPADALFFEILLESSNPRAKPDYVVRTPDRDFIAGPDRRAVMPELVAALNQQIIRRRLDVMHFHAGVMSFEGQGVLMPAYSGTGKTTLVAGLLSRGWKYLSDEFAMIDPDTLMIQPFPKPMCVKEGSWKMFADMGLPLRDSDGFAARSKWPRRYLNPLEISPNLLGEPCEVNWLFFLSEKDGSTRRIRRACQGDAAMLLYALGFNTRPFGPRGFQITTELARRARSFVIRRGPIEETCELLETIILEGSSAPELRGFFNEKPQLQTA